jgi:hypothetical protein
MMPIEWIGGGKVVRLEDETTVHHAVSIDITGRIIALDMSDRLYAELREANAPLLTFPTPQEADAAVAFFERIIGQLVLEGKLIANLRAKQTAPAGDVSEANHASE